MTKSHAFSVTSATYEETGGSLQPLDLSAALDQFKLGDFETRWEIAKALPQFGTAAIAPLIHLLQDFDDEDGDWDLPWFIAQVLGTFQHPEAIAALAELMRTTDQADVAEMAATALARCGVNAIACLTNLLQTSHTRPLAVQALAQIQHADVVAPLLSMTSDASPSIRSTVLDALSHFYHPTITRCLVQGLQDVSPLVRKAAIVGVGLQAELLDADPVELLALLLMDLNPSVSHQAALALGRLRTDQAAHELIQVLLSASPSIDLQLACVRALGWIQTPDALHGLAQGLDLATPVAIEIVTVLGRVQLPALKAIATQILVATVSTDGRQPAIALKQAIALSLGQLGDPQAVDSLIHLLADDEASVQFHAIAALKHLDAETVWQRFHHFFHAANSTVALKAGMAIAQQDWGWGKEDFQSN